MLPWVLAINFVAKLFYFYCCVSSTLNCGLYGLADFKNVSIVGHYVKDRTKDAQFIIIRQVWYFNNVFTQCINKSSLNQSNTYRGILVLLAALGTICLNWLIVLLVFIKLIIAQRASLSIHVVLWCAKKLHDGFVSFPVDVELQNFQCPMYYLY